MTNSGENPTVAERALDLITDGDTVGLGSGRAATEFIHVLGKRVSAGLRIRGVPTSEDSAALARQLGIPLIALDEVDSIDVDVDGADEVDPQLQLIKGYGGALLREKIVASASKRLVILVGAEKLVPILGSRGRLPVEVIPFGLALCRRRLHDLGLPTELRSKEGKTFVTDSGNQILDCRVGPLEQADVLEQAILEIPGVVETGLFLRMAHTILIQHADRVEVRERRQT